MANLPTDRLPALPEGGLSVSRIQDELHQVAALLSGARLMAQKIDEGGDDGDDDTVMLPYELDLLICRAKAGLAEIIERIEKEAGHD